MVLSVIFQTAKLRIKIETAKFYTKKVIFFFFKSNFMYNFVPVKIYSLFASKFLKRKILKLLIINY